MRKMLSDSILDLAKCLNRKNALSLSCVFWLGHFPRSKIESENIFLTKYYIITIKINAVFWFIVNKVKKDFPLHFQILRGRVQGFFFRLGS